MSGSGPLPTDREALTRGAEFQQWQVLLTNRAKRHRQGRLLVQGVRPISCAVAAGVPVLALLTDRRDTPSSWARELVASGVAQEVIGVDVELMAELGERSDGAPELLALVRTPTAGLDGLNGLSGLADTPLVLVLDRPTSPGNVGSLARSLDALAGPGAALVVVGHAADPWDPASVRASTGSIFARPVVAAGSPSELVGWVAQQRAGGVGYRIVGTDEHGAVDLPDADLSGPLVVVVGNETSGMSRAWHEACDLVVRIPMGAGSGVASSLNAANAGSIVLYEVARQRVAAPSGRD